MIFQDHVGIDRESLGLYIADKLPRQGRQTQICQVDIIGVDRQRGTVAFVIEIDLTTNPKDIVGAIATAALARNYTRSNSYLSYPLHDTSILFLTLSGSNSTKGTQLASLCIALEHALNIPSPKVRGIKFVLVKPPSQPSTFSGNTSFQYSAKVICPTQPLLNCQEICERRGDK